MNKRLLNFFLLFVTAYLLVSLFVPKPSSGTPPEEKPFQFQTVKEKYAFQDTVKVRMRNNTDKEQVVTVPCPNQPFTVYYEDTLLTAPTTYDCISEYRVAPKTEQVVSYAPWNKDLFTKTGNYRIEMPSPLPEEAGKNLVTYFKIEPKGWFAYGWESFFYRPIFNVLIFFTTLVPGGSFGLGIILLTLFFRFVLLIPNQRAMESQRVMQKLQPELKALQEKHKDDKEKLAQETMAFWKKHKVNPFGSCLPLLIQLPIVLAIFYAVQNGLDVASSYLLYEPLKNVNMQHVQTLFISLPFYTLDLAHKEPMVLPAIVGILQFIQMKVALPKLKAAQKKPAQDGMPDMQIVNQTMTYVLPLMLAFMAATIPAGVGLYWGVNTLFGIGQQFVVNKEKRLSAKNI